MKALFIIVFFCNLIILSSCDNNVRNDNKAKVNTSKKSENIVIKEEAKIPDTPISNEKQIRIIKAPELIGLYVDSLKNFSDLGGGLLSDPEEKIKYIYGDGYLINLRDSSCYLTLQKSPATNEFRPKSEWKIIDAIRIYNLSKEQWLNSISTICDNHGRDGEYFAIVLKINTDNKLKIFKVFFLDIKKERIIEVDKSKLKCEIIEGVD